VLTLQKQLEKAVEDRNFRQDGAMNLLNIDLRAYLGVIIVNNWLSVCLSHLFKLLLFLFLNGIEPFFGRQFSMWQSTKLFSSIFDLGP